MKRTSSVGGLRRRLSTFGAGGDASSAGSAGSVGPLKRVQSRKLVKGVKHLRQVPFQFKFELFVEYLDKCKAKGPVVVVWERGKEVGCTRVVMSKGDGRVVVEETLSKEVTMFKADADDQTFLDKVYKIAVRMDSAKGETVGKIHINFGDYAGVPSSSRKIAANLSDGSTLVARVTSSFLANGRKSKGTGSVGGGSTYAESDAGSLDEEETGEIDDFADLLDEDDENEKAEVKNKASHAKVDMTSSGLLDDDFEQKSAKVDAMASNATKGKSASSSKLARRQSVDIAPTRGSQLAKYEDLEKDNAVLKRKLAEAQRRIKELSAQNSTLMEDLAAEQDYDRQGSNPGSGGLASRAALQTIVQENKQLKQKLDEVTEILDREPEVEEMVRELKEIKMTIAIAQLEKDQAQLEVMQLKRELATVQAGHNGAGRQVGRLRLFW